LNFGGWHPLADGTASAPDRPGVLQARADEIRDYPRGRSAMVFYAHSGEDETLRRYVAGRGRAKLRRAADAGARWIRFGVTERPGAVCARLLDGFAARFGAPPTVNQAAPDDEGDADGVVEAHDENRRQ
jgi:hypothetical protein